MNTLDLDINSYSFDDLLNIFKIDTYDVTVDYKNKLKNKIDSVYSKYPKNICYFFDTMQNIVIVIFSLIENKIIQKHQIDEYYDKVLNIKNLNNLSQPEILNIVINNNDIDDIYTKENILHEPPVLNKKLNKPNYDIGSRIDPKIDFKNNTNEIVQTFPNTIAPGTLNSLKRITQLLNVNLHSCFRKNYYQSRSSDFLYEFPIEIRNVLSVRMVSIEIPNSWFLITNERKNNIFSIEMHVNNEYNEYLITIPDGNYDNNSLQEYLNTNFFCDSQMDTLLKYIKVDIPSTTLITKFCIVDLHNDILENEDYDIPDISFSIHFVDKLNQNIMDTLGWVLGFRQGNYLHINNSIKSEGLFDAGGDRYIYLALNDFQYNTNTSNVVCFEKSILNEDIIAKIPMINGKLSMVVNDNNNVLSKIRTYNGPVNFSKLQIKILDKFGNLINLNNMDYSLTLEMEIFYENFNFKNVAP